MSILCSLTNCVSVPALPVPLPALLPASIAVLGAVIVSASAPASVFSFFLSSSSLSSHKLSVMGPQSDSPLSLSQPSPPPPPPAFSATHRTLQAAHRV